VNRFRFHRPSPSARHEAGFTLVEALVAIAIIGVIVTPLASAFISAFKVSETTSAGLNASVNRDALSEYFTKDVARVDAAGVSTEEAKSCDTSPAGGGTLYVTFNSTRINNGTPVTDRVSYWAVGSGKEIDIVRRACTAVNAGTKATNGVEVTVAEKIGKDGGTIANTVYALYQEASGATPGFYYKCNEFICGMQIEGRFSMQVTAQRRLFGAGVPLETGKVYSSSFTRGVSGGQAYDLYDRNGAVTGKEAKFTDQITLGAGLDGPDSMSVRFAVQQVDSGLFLDEPTPGVRTFSRSAIFYVDGEYVNGLWRLPLRVGATDVMNRGGEYRIWTKIDPQEANLPTKDYGGTFGFPLWIDWRQQDSVFVNAATGLDTNSGLTRAAPVKTVARAFTVAAAASPKRIYIIATNNNFSESVDLTGAVGADHQVFVGGHDPTSGLRGSSENIAAVPARPHTAITGDPLSGTGYAIRVDNKQGIRFRQVRINSGNPPASSGAPGAAGRSTYGVFLTAPVGTVKTTYFEWSTITSRKAGDGFDGVSPPKPGPACWGATATGTGTNTGRVQRPGGVACNPTGNRRSGNGGAGGPQGGSGGLLNLTWSGFAGGWGGTGAEGGIGGRNTASVICIPGDAARPGSGAPSPTSVAIGASGSLTHPTPSASGWTPPTGSSGANGIAGGGGGGGGGGAGLWCVGDGGAGGAGGEGGVSGTGGGPGGPGGGSFGIYSYGDSQAFLFESPVVAGNGGDGGDGGRGGDGGDAGVGGDATSSGAFGLRGGAGAGGGSGGGGGGGGSAGVGGPSIGIYYQRQGPGTTGGTITAGTAGANGAAGAGGAGGAGGRGGLPSTTTVDFFFFSVVVTTNGGLEGGVGPNGASATTALPAQPPRCNYWSGVYSGGTATCETA
jgi:prepilin-type N-terminal cleavage/methylation domain-containing protein